MNNLNLCNPIDLMNEAALDIRNPVKGVQLPEWDRFNSFLGGLRPNEFTIFCGGTGIGKSQWLANLTAKLVDMGVKTLAAPVETGHVDLMRRIYSVYGKYDFNSASDMTMPMQANLKWVIENYSQKIAENLLVTDYDNRVDVDQLVLNLKYLSDTQGIKVALLDNLNFFMKPTRASDQMLEYDQVVHNFVMLAKKIPIHIILVMHPKKTEGGKIVSEFDIKGSSTAVQEATNVLLMNRLDESEMENGLTEFHREFVFKKIRRRGFFVNRKFYMRSENGKYIDDNGTGNSSTFQNKVGTARKYTGYRSGKSSADD